MAVEKLEAEIIHHTRHELAYLRELGRFSDVHKKSKAELLELYIAVAPNRVWGDVNSRKVVKYAQKLLEKERAANGIEAAH